MTCVPRQPPDKDTSAHIVDKYSTHGYMHSCAVMWTIQQKKKNNEETQKILQVKEDLCSPYNSSLYDVMPQNA